MTSGRAGRMARFSTGVRRLVAQVAVVGGFIAVGWLFAVLFAFLGSFPAAADSTVATEVAHSETQQAAAGPAPSRTGDFPTASGPISAPALAAGGTHAPGDAEAMAGRPVDGLTSQSTPVLPAPSTVDHTSGADGFVPHSGGSGQFGPGAGDVARSVYDPRLDVRRAPHAGVLPPIVRTAADEPTFSPD
ncbi:hypothetical protein Misp01_82930 [Microtetraspora sp. NBRC 13810]|uniref:hypothetical protein n=1 Tax=Microtetraspora sp. NBRC 13810 TaxID=3030990 RepID=UPI0024A0560C|nr:hypothetical protein [Microtetraspora sp. NBRC 13810]GLW13165.1 hypothetical protein Misp01_82930 [Microtetraspora sp. NBRC 13810]